MNDFPPVLVLAGGLGTRVSSLYPDLPKALIPINNEPFIAHQLRLLARERVSKVILCIGHLSQAIENYVGSGKSFGLNVKYSHDGEKLLGTGGAILKASRDIDGPVAVLYGDSFLDTNFNPIQKAFFQAKKLGLMTVYKNNNQEDNSNVRCQAGLVLDYNKKKLSSDMKFIDYGLSIFDQKAFKPFDQNKSFDLSEVFQNLIDKKQLLAFQISQRYYEIGSPSGLEALRKHLF